jgi:hypothetical protein
VRDPLLHILKYLHFVDNENPSNKNSPNYDRFRKLQKESDILNLRLSEAYQPTEHLSTDEITLLFEGKVVLRQYMPKKHKHFGIKALKTV